MRMNNSMLSESYAKGATEGNGSNMFIEDYTIYSYGHHYKIAVRLKLGQKFATGVSHVYNPIRYSSTTNKHQANVRNNLDSYIAIPDCNIEEEFLRNYVNELKLEVEEVRTKQNKLKSKGKRFYQFENKINNMIERVKEVEHFTVALYGGQAVHFIKQAS